MTNQDFIDAILAEPGDDAPRLIYADWLEERGNPRAEFIRLQVELATLARPPESNRYSMYGHPLPSPREPSDGARFKKMWARQMALLTRHCAEWVEPLIGNATGVIFERGCVEGFSAQAPTFVKHAELWYQSMPIRQLCVAAPMKDEEWLSLLGSPHLLNLRTLELGWGVHPTQLAALADCPYLASLEELLLRSVGRLDDELLQKLRQSPNLKYARVSHATDFFPPDPYLQPSDA
jgi:uncharacterized protein (TIGR02996 family)